VQCPPLCSEETQKPSASSKKFVVDGLDDDDPFLLVKRLVVFFHMVVALSLTNIYIWGFQLVTRYTNIILEYGLRVKLGCVLLNQTIKKDG
jgi:hypothetical protein